MTDTATAPAGPAYVQRLVAATAYSWLEANPHKPGEQLYFSARHGERISVSRAEAERGEALGGLVDEAKAAQHAQTVEALNAEVERLTAELAAARSNVVPAIIAPPPPPPTGVTLTPSATGTPMPTPLPVDVGPIGPTTAAAVAAARAAATAAGHAGPIVSVTPAGQAVAAAGPNVGDVNPMPLGVNPEPAEPGAVWTDEQLTAAKADELVVYLNQHSDNPDEVDRVDELEATRGGKGPRVTVTAAIEAIRAAQEQA